MMNIVNTRGKKQGGTHDSDSLEEYGKTWTFAKKKKGLFSTYAHQTPVKS